MRIGTSLIAQGCVPPTPPLRWATRTGSLDAALGGGFASGQVHEIYAVEPGDMAAAAGFVAAIAIGIQSEERARGGTMLWLRTRRDVARAGVLQANGWAELGGRPENCLFGIVPDTLTLLRATADALRCTALSAVIVESWGRMTALDMTTGRRFVLAAERSGTPLFLLRADAMPTPSAAHTRWRVASAPSQALPGRAPGVPAFDITLLRQRSGPSGLGWRLEWDRDQRQFRETAVSGAVLPVPVHRPNVDTGAGALRHDIRHAA